MAAFTDQEIAEFQEGFNLFDQKGDGKIYASQMGEVLRALGQNPTEAEVRKCGFATNPDRRITFEEFLPILHNFSKRKDTTSSDDFVEGFKVFDKEQNGYISSAELRHLLTHLGEKMKDEEVEQLFAGQEDNQGNIHYEEFVKMVMNG